jgi:hyperosmotically inducible periplasmic protein
MTKLLLTSIMVAALCLALGGCHNTGDTTTGSNPQASKAKMSDADLENNITAKLNADPQLKAADLDVDADVSDNKVTLSGTVDSEALRMKAVEMAKSVQPNLIITDKIDVKPREVTRATYTEEQARQEREKGRSTGDKIGDTLDDAWIHTKIVTKLIANSNTPERKINVDVMNSVVTLRGNVDSNEQKVEAEQVAKNTEGVKSVSNQLKVGGTSQAKTPTGK